MSAVAKYLHYLQREIDLHVAQLGRGQVVSPAALWRRYADLPG